MKHVEGEPNKNSKTQLAKTIVGNQHMGFRDVVQNAAEVYAASLQNDATLGIEGVDAKGNAVGIVFTDPRLAVLYSEETDRTVVTLRRAEKNETEG
jgi:hypothetical protein